MELFKRNNQEDTKLKHSSAKKRRTIALLLIIWDAVAANVAYFLALWLRFDCRVSEIFPQFIDCWMKFAPTYAIISVTVIWLFRLYQSLWRFVSFEELKKLCVSSVLLGVLHAVLITVLFGRMPISYYILGTALQFFAFTFPRFFYRFITLERDARTKRHMLDTAGRVMLIGGGAAGQMILRDLHSTKVLNERVCCIIDDDPNKLNCFIDGVPIVGGRDEILYNVKKYLYRKFSSRFLLPQLSKGEIFSIFVRRPIASLKNCPVHISL